MKNNVKLVSKSSILNLLVRERSSCEWSVKLKRDFPVVSSVKLA